MDFRPKTPSRFPTRGKLLQRLSSRYREFSKTGAFSGLLLLVAATAAVIWANSDYGEFYTELWNAPLEISLSDFHLEESLLLWINDALMAIFFFYVGLEIKREIMVGELSQPGQAVLPIIAALGGMLVPAGLFFLLTGPGPEADGWGVPMATDIAFSLGLLMLLGKRVPDSIKIFLTAFAIVDDLAAVLIIAVFYSKEVHLPMLFYAGILYALMWGLNLGNIRNRFLYTVFAIGMWYFFLESGVHPTVAGILAALAIPANTRLNMEKFVRETSDSLEQFEKEDFEKYGQFLTDVQLNAIDTMNEHIDAVQPPLQRLENGLHQQVSFFIMPVFALANAGVVLQAPGGGLAFSGLSLTIALSLVLGKVIGITLFSWLGVRLGLSSLPAGMNWVRMIGVGLLGGVGFTMALFIAGLAYEEPLLLDEAKIGILLGSLVAGVGGILVLWFSLPKTTLS